MDSSTLSQIADRARRIETRVTKIANHLGLDAGGEPPRWVPGDVGRVDVPTPMCSLKDCIAAVPDGWPKDEHIEVYVRNGAGRSDFMMAFTTG